MKVILYMAMTANGLIAKKDDDTSWISKEEWDSYSAFIKKTGNCVVGRRTYHILTNQPEFSELKNISLIVLSTENFETKASNHIIANSPKEALEKLADFSEVVVAGGGITNAAFLSENLVDEIVLDVEPVMFSKGLPLAYGKDFDKKLKLLKTKPVGESGIQLHYEVVK
ncbi:MAG TPA: dihydrofolate reductase [Candidatus Paceibacterota bacterium]|nr:dihydrofolate reductase [Candidatus Paceibacterota bacterium]